MFDGDMLHRPIDLATDAKVPRWFGRLDSKSDYATAVAPSRLRKYLHRGTSEQILKVRGKSSILITLYGVSPTVLLIMPGMIP